MSQMGQMNMNMFGNMGQTDPNSLNLNPSQQGQQQGQMDFNNFNVNMGFYPNMYQNAGTGTNNQGNN